MEKFATRDRKKQCMQTTSRRRAIYGGGPRERGDGIVFDEKVFDG